MIRFLYIVLFISVLSYAEMIDGVAIKLGDAIITTYDIEQEMQTSHVDKKTAQEILIRKKLEEIEVEKRGIHVSETEVYDEIRRLASVNNITISQFYDAVRESNGLSSAQLKEKVKERLLSQKLYQAIAMSKMKEPSEDEIQEYIQLHKDQFSQPQYYDVIVYIANSRELLQQKMTNPMFFSAQISQQSQRLYTDKINPQLATMLLKTGEGHFTPIVPNTQHTFMTFYIQAVGARTTPSLEQIKSQVVNALMSEKRAAILDDYFAKLKDNTDIQYIR